VRRLALISVAGLAALAALSSTANAAVPSLGAVSASNIQGVSALLVGTVNPQGLPTSYHFDYVDDAAFSVGGFSGADATAATDAGTDSIDHPARASISGLAPDTVYHFRLVAGNSSGTTTGTSGDGTAGTFTTTHGFGFLPGTEGFSVAAIADGDVPAEIAGTHPYQLNLALDFNRGGDFEDQPGVPFPDGDLRDLRIDLPPGLLANPRAVDKCKLVDFNTPRTSPFEESLSGESCPDRTQVGTIEVRTSRDGGVTRRFGLFNLDPPPGVAAQLGASPFGASVVLDVAIQTNADNSYTLILKANDFPQVLDVSGISLAFWGIPWNTSHNGERGDCLNEAEPTFPWAKCSVGDPLRDSGTTPLAYLTLPTSCGVALAFTVTADAWQQPLPATSEAVNSDSGGPVNQIGCQGFSFFPNTEGFLTDTKASSASGFNFRLSNDNKQLTIPTQQLPSQTRRAEVTLPPGVTINPSLGAGLIGCTPGQYAAETAFSSQGAGCPNGSKIGSFRVRTPLFTELIDGAVYLAQPNDVSTPAPGAENPFDSLIAVYLVAKSPARGILIKVAGNLVPDQGTGRLTAIFDGLPQLPYTDLNIDFRTGQRAPLVTPAACGKATTKIDLTPWSGPGARHISTDSQIQTGVDGGPCPSGTPPFAPDVTAGGVNSNVNSYTPYFVHLTRRDTEQEITSYSLVLPEGITGKLAGVAFCPDAAIEAARLRTGTAELASPSCPASSLVGHTHSGYGVGTALTYSSGRIFLAGPYHGAPLSLVTINSATVGPFDLGTIVIRSAFQVDPLTAQLRIDSSSSDPIPHIIDGVPLHLRDVRVYVDRPNFTHNPSSCAPSQLVSSIGGSGASFDTGADDTTSAPTSPFQLLNCLTIGFRPKLGVRLRGGIHRGDFPQLRATFAARGPQDSNLKQIAVTLPHQMFLAQEHIREICTRVQFNSRRCPPDSVYGSAVAYTPLLDQPLRGNVYLRSSAGRQLPDLVADLYSGAVRIVLEGAIGPGKKGGIRAFFANLPDQPLDRFVMTLDGGKRGLLVNSANICALPPKSSVKALAQNNIGAVFTTVLRGQCNGKKQQGRGGR
jgi:hypothetical protein